MNRATGETRIDFALITLTGNFTRYQIIRPLVDAMPGISACWYPIRTWVAGDWTHMLPGLLRIRLRHFLDSWRFLVLPSADAAVIHAFETWPLYVLIHKVGRRRPVVVAWPDAVVGFNNPQSMFSRLAMAYTDLVVHWHEFAHDEARRRYPWFPAGRMKVLHPGIDLTKWPMRQAPEADPEERFRLLFVGGDLIRKGVHALLEAMSGPHGLAASGCVLDLCTQSAYLNEDRALRERILATPGVRLHEDLANSDEHLRTLYRHADVFVLPTTNDISPWVVLEAQATGVPVIATAIGGISDFVTAGVTGMLVPVGDSPAIIEAVERLRQDERLRRRLAAQARAHVEQHYDAARNVAQLMRWIVELTEDRPLTEDDRHDQALNPPTSEPANSRIC